MSARLAAYLARLGLADAPSPDAEGLAALQRAHRLAIPFENLDIPLGRGIRIDAESAFDKLVTRRRGGYCFEQNRVFADMLTAIGFANSPLLARVRLGQPGDAHPTRSHMLLLTDIGSETWIADAGFGGSYVPPLPLADGAQAATPDGALHRLRHGPGGPGGDWLLERAGPVGSTDGRAFSHTGWQPQYSFDLAEVAPADLDQANHWTSTRPETRFTTLHLASIALEDGFAALTDRQLSVSNGGATQVRELTDAESWRRALAEMFTIDLRAEDVAALPLWP